MAGKDLGQKSCGDRRSPAGGRAPFSIFDFKQGKRYTYAKKCNGWVRVEGAAI